MKELLAIGLGGFIGAISRYSLGATIHRQLGNGFPFGTLAVNALGCFAIGVVMTLADAGAIKTETRLVIATGFLGSLTTFSTFSYETFALLQVGRTGAAVSNMALNGAIGLIAVLLGHFISKPFVS